MEFSVTKKGYSPKEVEEYIAAVKREYESTIVKQRERIQTMLEEKEAAEKELAAYREKSSQISKAIMSAVAKAEEIEKLSHIKYNQEITRLKAFHEKWTQYYEQILDEYPLDARLAGVGEFNRRMDKILSRVSDDGSAATSAPAVKIVDVEKRQEEQSVRKTAEVLSPIEKIDKYFESEKESDAAEEHVSRLSPLDRARQTMTAAASVQKKDYADRSPSGFSFEEALNPTEDLESILKDLGL